MAALQVAVEEVHRNASRRGDGGSALARLLDECAAAAVDRCEPERIMALLVQLADAGLEEGRLLKVGLLHFIPFEYAM